MTEHVEVFDVRWPALAVHGGAGSYRAAAETLSGLLAGVDAALDAGWARIEDPLSAALAAVRHFEDDGRFNAGRGSVPNTAGQIEMDGGAMDWEGRAGAVACITGHSAVAAAVEVLRLAGTLLLAGAGADAFCQERGLPRIAPARQGGSADPVSMGSQGTVGAVAVSSDGRFAVATSTGGRPGQMPGRVGDTPVAGAGFWCAPGGAVAATGAGEAFVLAGFGRLAVESHAGGEDLGAALARGLSDVARWGGDGGAVGLGADRTFAAAFSTRAMARGVRHAGGRWSAIDP